MQDIIGKTKLAFWIFTIVSYGFGYRYIAILCFVWIFLLTIIVNYEKYAFILWHSSDSLTIRGINEQNHDSTDSCKDKDHNSVPVGNQADKPQ